MLVQAADELSGGSMGKILKFQKGKYFVSDDELAINTTMRIVLAVPFSAVAASTRLPGLPDKGDVTDWLDADPGRVDNFVNVCFDRAILETER
jgi:hypothetical protein